MQGGGWKVGGPTTGGKQLGRAAGEYPQAGQRAVDGLLGACMPQARRLGLVGKGCARCGISGSMAGPPQLPLLGLVPRPGFSTIQPESLCKHTKLSRQTRLTLRHSAVGILYAAAQAAGGLFVQHGLQDGRRTPAGAEPGHRTGSGLGQLLPGCVLQELHDGQAPCVIVDSETHRCIAAGAAGERSAAAAATLLSARARQPLAETPHEPRWLMTSQYSSTASCSNPAAAHHAQHKHTGSQQPAVSHPTLHTIVEHVARSGSPRGSDMQQSQGCPQLPQPSGPGVCTQPSASRAAHTACSLTATAAYAARMVRRATLA